MAKQAGHIKITGTIGNLTYYKMGGNTLCTDEEQPYAKRC